MTRRDAPTTSGRGFRNRQAAGVGVDVMVYEVCDRFRQCVTQEVAVIVAGGD